MNPFEFLDEFFYPKTKVLGLYVGEDFVILPCVVFTQCQRLTDRRTDRQTFRSQLVQGLHSTAMLTPCKKSAQGTIIHNERLERLSSNL